MIVTILQMEIVIHGLDGDDKLGINANQKNLPLWR